MRNFLSSIILNSFSLWLVSGIFPGLVLSGRIKDIFWAGTIFTLINLVIKPIIKIFLLPINLITLGFFRWLANVIILLILTKIISYVSVTAFVSQAISQNGFAIPPVSIGFTASLIITSFLLSFVFNVFQSLLIND